jgi:septum formation protein
MILKYLPFLNQLEIVLASASPRRRELLERIGLRVVVSPSGFAENLDKATFGDPSLYPLETAKEKAKDVLFRLGCAAEKVPDLIISADSVVVLRSEAGAATILEKASCREDAAAMIRLLQGRRHVVYTGLVLLFPKAKGEPITAPDWSPCAAMTYVEATTVQFAEMDEENICSYVDSTAAWQGKAGAYGIQDLASAFIERIEGDYYNVMGFPVHRFTLLLSEAIRRGFLSTPFNKTLL